MTDTWRLFGEAMRNLAPTAVTLIAALTVVLVVRYILNRRYADSVGFRFRIQFIILFLSFAGLVAVILASPIGESSKTQLLSLIGILLSAALALSSTTFLGNILAGLMQRAVGSVQVGDFIRVREYFGRVSELGLFHVEIQTEDRDLTTMPNLFLATHPVKVIRGGTLVTAEVSLGYDVGRKIVSKKLQAAAAQAGLEEAFVHIIELGDFSVTYRVSGILRDVRSLLSARSHLCEQILDQCHAAGIEIVSPNFMNQRVLDAQERIIPSDADLVSVPAPDDQHLPEERIFDKAERAQSLERLRHHEEMLKAHVLLLENRSKKASDDAEKSRLTRRVESLQSRLEEVRKVIETESPRD